VSIFYTNCQFTKEFHYFYLPNVDKLYVKLLLVIVNFFLVINSWANQELYTSNHEGPIAVSKTSQVLNNQIKGEESLKVKAPKKNILFFVHGRGKHPEKGIKSIHQLKSEHNLKVTMFH
jgi:hypothetical protein